MTISRRVFLNASSLLMLRGLGPGHGGAFAAKLPIADGRLYEPSSEHPKDAISFGVGPTRELLDAKSYYKVPGALSQQDRLCFDVSNNRISCSINAHGLLERFAIQLGVAPVEVRGTPVGAYVEKVLARVGPWPISVVIGEAEPVRLNDLPQPEIHLENNLFPRYEWTIGDVKISMLVFAPHAETDRPRAVCTLWSAHALSKPVAPIRLQHPDAGSTVTTAVLYDDGHGWKDTSPNLSVALDPAQPLMLAVLVGSDQEDVARTRTELNVRSGMKWLAMTKEQGSSRYGALAIPETPFYAELFTRATELSRQSLMLDAEGRFGGSFNGSDLPVAANVWMRDCFYSSLPQTFFSPQLSSSAILFFLQWGVADRPLGEHADRFPGAAGVTNSLGNSVAGIVLAGEHYARNNDKEFFLRHPEILTRSTEILEHVLASRREDVFLFPSIYVSDGESRGDFHTGSNIFLWRAFRGMARLSGEVYGHPESASMWQSHADRLRLAILAECVAQEGSSKRLVEAAMQDHTRISGHDGEESDVTLAAFYGFCQPDDDIYLNAARAALSPSNPYAIPQLEGVWWYAHAKWSSATFPGWMTALASSGNEEELLRHLERIRTLTDADGSFWWWPYPHDAALHEQHPLRTNSKCGWAAGVYACLFLHQVLGLTIDAPAHQLAFRPFCPWKEFSWADARLGDAHFDCSYVHRDGQITLAIRNRTAQAMEVTLQTLLPSDAQLLRASTGDSTDPAFRKLTQYSRPAIEIVQNVTPGKELTLTVTYR